MKSIKWKLALLATATAAIVAGCGGGSADPTSQRAGITSVKVMGDSLSDSGVFENIPGLGRTFSVQGSASEPNTVWTERIASLLGTSQVCNYYQTTVGVKPGSTPPEYIPVFTTPNANCSSYAVGGGRINNLDSVTFAEDLSPYSIVYQMEQAIPAAKYSSSDLLLIDGGGNDAADLIKAYLAAGQGNPTSFVKLTKSLVPTVTTSALVAGGSTYMATVGSTYMEKLADKFYKSITDNALNQGATKVLVLNMPSVTKTPDFQNVLNYIASVNGSNGPVVRASAEALFMSWLETFNARLKELATNERRVAVVDFFGAMNDQVASPAQYGLTNVESTACAGYSFQTCTATALSAKTGTTDPNWWQKYAFSDGFHPTPYGHQLLSQLVAKSLATAGWL